MNGGRDTALGLMSVRLSIPPSQVALGLGRNHCLSSCDPKYTVLLVLTLHIWEAPSLVFWSTQS